MMKRTITIIAFAILLAVQIAPAKDQVKKTSTITGEVVDLSCYLDYGSIGPRHESCARTCIAGGRPAALRAKDGRLYVFLGAPATLSKELAPLAARIITVSGNIVSRDGIQAIENVQIVAQ